jgi:uncharacterized protein YjbI with pentapeptide repeats
MKKLSIQKLNPIQWLGIGFFLLGILIFLATVVLQSLVDNLLKDYLVNVSTDLIFVSITVLIIDSLNKEEARKRERQDLIFRMGSANNVVATEAARRLKAGDFWIFSLRGERFPNADLTKADLKGADLRDVDLFGTNLTEANLENSHMEGAIIIDTNFRKADLSNAHLEGAFIRATINNLFIFKDANLHNANLNGATFSIKKEETMVEDESLQLRHAYRLNHAIMPNGNRYDGRYRLGGDINQPGVSEKEGDESFMASFYGVPVEEYQEGQKWYRKNLFSERNQIFLS